MKPRHLEVLHAIMQTGSVTNAARLLNVTPPSVSSALQQCEVQLGMRLFERVGGRLKPTPEAKALLPLIKDAFQRLGRVSEHAVALASGRTGTLSIGGTLALANGYLVEAVARFRRERPDVSIELHSLETPDIIERVVWRELDMGVCYGPVLDAALEVEPLASKALVCVLPEKHRLAGKDALEVDDIVAEPLITYDPQDRLRSEIDDVLRAASTAPRFAVQVNQTITALRLVQEGAGIAIVNPFIFVAMNLAGLVAKPLLPRRTLEAKAIFPAASARSRVTTEFVKILHSVVGPG